MYARLIVEDVKTLNILIKKPILEISEILHLQMEVTIRLPMFLFLATFTTLFPFTNWIIHNKFYYKTKNFLSNFFLLIDKSAFYDQPELRLTQKQVFNSLKIKILQEQFLYEFLYNIF